MAKKKVPTIVCDVCGKKVAQDKAKGSWLHIPTHFTFGKKASKRPVAIDLCTAKCAKKWIAAHPAFAPEPEIEPEPSVAEIVEQTQENVVVTEDVPAQTSKKKKAKANTSAYVSDDSSAETPA